MESTVDTPGNLAGISSHQPDNPDLRCEYTSSGDQGALQRRLDQLVNDLVLFEQSSTTHSGTPSQFNRQAVQKLFTTRNFDKAIDAIFRQEHPTFPLVHRPTFDPRTCTLPLLLTVFAAGYIHTSSIDLCPKATGIAWIDMFEDYVFADQQFSLLAHLGRTNCADRRKHHLESIIAAVVITYLQLGSSNAHTRYRMHHQRFPAILDAARSVNLFDSAHHSAAPREDEMDWRRWIEDETAIR